MIKKDTPLMTQYKEIKRNYPDSILFFRLGDFYEMFFEDAVTASKELGLTLTSRNREKDQDVPLAGVPYHSSSSYIARLVEKGYSVAVCEQVENPRDAVGIVKREVVRVITPGTVIDTDYLDEKSNNYVMGIKAKDDVAGIAFLDITTGEFKTSQINVISLLGEIKKISPREIIADEKTIQIVEKIIKNYHSEEKILLKKVDETRRNEEFLKEYFGVISLESFNLKGKDLAISSAAFVLRYVLDLQKGGKIPVKKIEYQNSEAVLELNYTTQKNLEIAENSVDKTSYGTLFWVLDSCKCSMGSRLLKRVIKNPLKNVEEIRTRQEHVEFFIKNVLLREEVTEKLSEVYDVERILGKLIMGTENGRDLVALKKSIFKAIELHEILSGNELCNLDKSVMYEIYNLIENVISDDPPFSIREGGIIKSGVSEELDELHHISTKGKDYVLELEAKERQRTGIKNLKIKFNKVFGYFIEITNGNKNEVPLEYVRKQTLSNAERYIIPDLKEYEEKILHAKERIEALEYEIFKKVSERLKEHSGELQDIAQKLAYLDLVSCFANVSIKNNYTKPEISEEFALEILGGRHPVVENIVKKGEFVKNDIHLDELKKVIILTGPNMAGKSTYMKQVALILIMAHIGCFVPADYAIVPVTDKIFTRIGASDDLISGQSTFMLEMSEMANIINTATENSFIVLDEIGRGTSTFDGISIATAITEYIHNNIGAKTIFATHYHELTQLEEELIGVANYRIEVSEEKEIVFLRKIVRGGADKSYGIEVAKLAGLPGDVLKRSNEILEILEKQREIVEKKIGIEQLKLFGQSEANQNKTLEIVEKSQEKRELSRNEIVVLTKLGELDINSISPLEAFQKLNELKIILG